MLLNYRGIQKYNTDIKFCGNNVSIKLYDDYQLKGYSVDSSGSFDGGFPKSKEDIKVLMESYVGELTKIKCKLKLDELEMVKEERWHSSNRRAKQRVMDLVACNADKWEDYDGGKQYTKFVTLTFRNDDMFTRDLEWCNNEVSKYMKKICYNLYDRVVYEGTKREKIVGLNKNVLKYISVPELQERGVWHFHIVFFNMPYVKHSKLLKWWGGSKKGSVNIKAIKEKSEGMVSRYVVKYMTSGMGKEDKKKEVSKKAEYNQYLKLGLEDSRRYNPSRGLHQPIKISYNADKSELEEVVKFLSVGGYLEQLTNETTNTIDYHVVESEERGIITYINFTIKDKKILSSFKNNMHKVAYERRTIWQEKQDFEKNRRIIEKIRYSMAFKKGRIKNMDEYFKGDEKIKRRKGEKILGFNYVTEEIIRKVG